jgi:magnesium-transporting ATPase (P-type)
MNVKSPPAPAPDATRDLSGLSEAEAATRLATYGPNRLSEQRTRRLDEIALQALREPMFLLLLTAVTLYFAMGDMAEALFLLLGAAATIGLAIGQEARSERALAALRRLAEPTGQLSCAAVSNDGSRLPSSSRGTSFWLARVHGRPQTASCWPETSCRSKKQCSPERPRRS